MAEDQPDDLPDMGPGDVDSLVDAANEQAGATDAQKQSGKPAASPADVPSDAPSEEAGPTVEETRDSAETEELLARAEKDLEKALSGDLDDTPVAETADAKPFEFRDLEGGGPTRGPLPISALQDVELDLRIELGRTELLIDDVMKLAEGSVVQLDKLAGDPVDIRVNGRLIARGEVLVLNDNFCVRVAEILTPEEAA